MKILYTNDETTSLGKDLSYCCHDTNLLCVWNSEELWQSQKNLRSVNVFPKNTSPVNSKPEQKKKTNKKLKMSKYFGSSFHIWNILPFWHKCTVSPWDLLFFSVIFSLVFFSWVLPSSYLFYTDINRISWKKWTKPVLKWDRLHKYSSSIHHARNLVRKSDIFVMFSAE